MAYIRNAAFFAAMLAACVAQARDTTGLSDTLSPDQQEWVRSLHSGNSVPCCDNADGIDPEWDTLGTSGTRYRVRYQGQWLDVDASALLTLPNKIGVARAWMGYRDGNPFVRCFLPGPSI